MNLFLNLVRETIGISKIFGLRHAFTRIISFIKIKIEGKRKTHIYNKLKPTGVVIKEIMGNRMRLDMNDYGIHRDLFIDKIREPVATAHISKVLSKDDIVVDLGANIGYYALIESKICKKVYAIEPVEKNIEFLKSNVELNKCENIEIFPMAIGDKPTLALMNISSTSNLHSFYPLQNAVCKKEMEMDTLDNFLKDKEKPTFVRMDIEGYELKVLHGMKDTLKYVDRLFIEVHADIMRLNETREFIDILSNNDFNPELIIHYDQPKFSKVLPNSHLRNIYIGDKGSYEIFFKKNSIKTNKFYD